LPQENLKDILQRMKPALGSPGIVIEHYCLPIKEMEDDLKFIPEEFDNRVSEHEIPVEFENTFYNSYGSVGFFTPRICQVLKHSFGRKH